MYSHVKSMLNSKYIWSSLILQVHVALNWRYPHTCNKYLILSTSCTEILILAATDVR